MHTSPLTTDFSEYLVNRMYDRNFLEREMLALLPPESAASATLEQLRSIYSGKKLEKMNEAQLREQVIRPTLELLGWQEMLSEEITSIQGKQIKPDWVLFSREEDKEAFQLFVKGAREAKPDGVVLCEVKAADKNLDTKKAARKDNPYIQLLEYLTYARLSFGFLTNGLEWWLVDNSRMSSDKRYVRVHLERIIKDGEVEYFRYFLHLFHRERYFPAKDEIETPMQALSRLDAEARYRVEEDLRCVVYGIEGRYSLFERLGHALHAALDEPPTPANLRLVFENSLYLIFRLLFIAYFEDKYGDQLKSHPSYDQLSLKAVLESLEDKTQEYLGWHKLKTLFTTLAGGNADLGIPLLNGGLFNPGRATLLDRPRVMNNDTLKAILHDLLYYEGGMLRRDFRTLSVTHLGTIYEGLLEFEYRVAEEPLCYLEYKEKNKTLEGYFDAYDAEVIRAKTVVLFEHAYAPGEIYLVGTQNSRKQSGSYYTPSSLSLPLVSRAIDHQLEKNWVRAGTAHFGQCLRFGATCLSKP